MTVEAIFELQEHLQRVVADRQSSVDYWDEELERVLQYEHTTSIPGLIPSRYRKLKEAHERLAVATQRLEVFESLLRRAKQSVPTN